MLQVWNYANTVTQICVADEAWPLEPLEVARQGANKLCVFPALLPDQCYRVGYIVLQVVPFLKQRMHGMNDILDEITSLCIRPSAEAQSCYMMYVLHTSITYLPGIASRRGILCTAPKRLNRVQGYTNYTA